MPRLPYLPLDLTEPAAIIGPIRERRGGTLLNLDRMLLYSPTYARGWNALLGAVRGELSISPRLRELAICAIAVLNGADYEYFHHVPEFRAAGGSEEQAAALRSPDRAARNAVLFTPVERAVLRLTVDLTREARLDDTDARATRALLGDDRQFVELIGVVATYNMVSRFLVALDIRPEGGEPAAAMSEAD